MSPSDEYLKLLDQAKRYHQTSKTYTGTRTYQAIPDLRQLCKQHGAKTLLDYAHRLAGNVADLDKHGDIISSRGLTQVFIDVNSALPAGGRH